MAWAGGGDTANVQRLMKRRNIRDVNGAMPWRPGQQDTKEVKVTHAMNFRKWEGFRESVLRIGLLYTN